MDLNYSSFLTKIDNVAPVHSKTRLEIMQVSVPDALQMRYYFLNGSQLSIYTVTLYFVDMLYKMANISL